MLDEGMKSSSTTWLGAIPQGGADSSAETSCLSMDNEAFAGFYQRTARPVWSYLVHVSGNATLADDILQESYLRFLCAARLGDGEAACRRYLFRIATNLLRDHWRRRSWASLEDLPEEALGTDDCRDLARIEWQEILAPAWQRMRPRERQLLWLAYAEGATHREIAEITGLHSAGIRILLFRARRKMARLLKHDAAGPEKGS